MRSFRDLRKAAGFSTQQEFAICAKTTRAQVAKWETGSRYPRPTAIPHLAEVLNCSEREVISAISEAKRESNSKAASKGRFRSQCEYIVWGSKGAMPIDRPVKPLPGVFSHINEAKRIHQTVKPLALMREVIQIAEPGGRILDPFAGSGTTILAAKLEGYEATGIEIMEEYAGVARKRLMDE